ncbi:MAG: trigger factor [Clostridia bacterium]|nr:trigger factor [Clostridia bacterium]
MALNKVENGEHSIAKMEFTIERASFDAEVDKVFKQKSKNISVPGFRKGHAPRNIIVKMYGEGIFFDDALNNLLPDVYEAAVKEANLKVVGRPKIDLVSMDGDVILSAEVPVYPEVKIGEYKGLSAVKKVEEVTDEEVNREIKMVQERNSRETSVTDRPAQIDDTVVLDYEGKIDDVPFEGGKGLDQNLKLGSNTFIPGFEDQIVGHRVDDAFDVNVTFPEDYHAEELKGKAAVFSCKLKAINKIELPALDDEFAKDVSEFDTYAEYEADVRAKIAKRHEESADIAFENALLSKLTELIEADIPEAMFETEAENQLRDFDNQLRMQGLDLNTYTKYTGSTLDTLRQHFKPQAERTVKTRLALLAVADAEKIEISDEEVDEEIKSLATKYNMDADKVREMVSIDDVKEDLKAKKAVKVVKDNATILDKEPESETAEKPAEETEAKKPAKKTTRKSKKESAEEAPEA